MTKPVITTRAAKGAALTYSELDTNFTNLRNATLTVRADTDSKALNLNDTLEFIAGTNITLSLNLSTGALTINSSGGSSGNLDSLTDVVISSPSTGQILKYNGALGYWQNAAAGYLGAVGEDTTPMLGGNLSASSYYIYSNSVSTDQKVDFGGDTLTLLSYDKGSPQKGTSINLNNGPQNGIELITSVTSGYKPPIGLVGNRVVVGQPSGDTTNTTYITTNATGSTTTVDLVLNTGDANYLSSSSANIRIGAGTNGTITLTPNGSGSIALAGPITTNSTTGTPSNTSSPASWLKVTVSGTIRYIPLYS